MRKKLIERSNKEPELKKFRILVDHIDTNKISLSELKAVNSILEKNQSK